MAKHKYSYKEVVEPSGPRNMPKMPKRIMVEKAGNGYSIRHTDENGHDKMMVAKDMEEVHGIMKKMMM